MFAYSVRDYDSSGLNRIAMIPPMYPIPIIISTQISAFWLILMMLVIIWLPLS